MIMDLPLKRKQSHFRCNVALSMRYCGVNPKDLYSDVSCSMKPHVDTCYVSRAFELCEGSREVRVCIFLKT